MSSRGLIIDGLRELAGAYDALICDVWGVIHDGVTADLSACAALKEFRSRHGPVVLLSNAPRPVSDLLLQFERLGIPEDCYDEIVTSGVAAREDIANRGGRPKIFHLGPERDRGIVTGLNIELVSAANAELILCTGLFDDELETPAMYRRELAKLRNKGLVMLCANPDYIVQRGSKKVYCAGALALEYEKAGGAVRYFGKPHPEIFARALAGARGAARPLVIGDGLETDIRGANRCGADALFIAGGIHGNEVERFETPQWHSLFKDKNLAVRAVMRRLVW
ncbi:MAG: TIGR01459 family HAD-type hydrolase [Alphaproteobacteria bacterium]|nr:TIGR01459 family HAD-type hydrolase [Alphaproteobacteria bacterium]